MSFFKISRGDSSRISMDITPFQDGCCYFTSDDRGFYIDILEDNGIERRVRINPDSNGTSKAVFGTLTKDGWVDRCQTLRIAGLGADQNGFVGIAQNASESQMETAMNARLPIHSQADDSITVFCMGDIPRIDIPVVTILLA